ncbi:MAG: hypothetical protein LBQ21_07425 [Clostridiales Family XIII bacterium]|jgi:hypothetical protein|nr:hypothetical protein [Clostridiales Family XIII bacterium]
MEIIDGRRGVDHVASQQIADMQMATIGSGDYVLDIGNKFAYTVISNNEVDVSDGVLIMQGRRGITPRGITEQLIIENGTQGAERHDLIVCRYTISGQPATEDMELMVVKGTPNAGDPAINDGTVIRDGASIHDFALYRVRLSGIDLVGVDTLFSTLPQVYMPGGITTELIADGAITMDKIASGQVAAEGKYLRVDITPSMWVNNQCLITSAYFTPKCNKEVLFFQNDEDFGDAALNAWEAANIAATEPDAQINLVVYGIVPTVTIPIYIRITY